MTVKFDGNIEAEYNSFLCIGYSVNTLLSVFERLNGPYESLRLIGSLLWKLRNY